MNLVRSTELPSGVQGPVVDSDFGDTVAMLIAIHGKRYGYRELRDYADKIHDEMRTVREVGKLVTYGTQREEIRITGSLERMAQYFADPASGHECPGAAKRHPERGKFRRRPAPRFLSGPPEFSTPKTKYGTCSSTFPGTATRYTSRISPT